MTVVGIDPTFLIIDKDEYTITPTFIEVFGRSSQDQHLDLLIEKHGLGKLAAALTYGIPYAEGEMSERVAARELDFQYAFAIAILQALRKVVLDIADEQTKAIHLGFLSPSGFPQKQEIGPPRRASRRGSAGVAGR